MNDKEAKALLKQAHGHLSSGDHASAAKLSAEVSEDAAVSEVLRYSGLLLLGLSLQNQRKYVEGEAAFRRAISLQPSTASAFNGLAALFEASGDEDALKSTLNSLLSLLAHAIPIDAKKYVATSSKLLALFERDEEWSDALAVVDSLIPLVDPKSPSHSAEVAAVVNAQSSDTLASLLRKAVTLQETHDAETMEREVELRRRRLGAADLATTRRIVESEIVSSSRVHVYYTKSLDLLENSSEEYAQIQQRLFVFLLKKLRHVSDVSAKMDMTAQARALARKLVTNASHEPSASPICFEFLINTQNVGSATDYEAQLMSEAASKCGLNSAIGLAARSYLNWIQRKDGGNEQPTEKDDDPMDDMLAAYELDNDLVFVNHILAAMYFESKDFESSIAFCKKSLQLLNNWSVESGEVLISTILSVDLILAEAYVSIGPKFHSDSVKLCTSILQRDPNCVAAHYALAKSYLAVQKFSEAMTQLSTILTAMDPDNDLVISDVGWIHHLTGNSEEAISHIERAVSLRDRALHRYRWGKVLWSLNQEKEAYMHFLACVKMDPLLPGAFTAVGLFCLQMDGNRARARKCFEKALEVDGADEEAAVEIVKLLVDDGEVDTARAVLLDVSLRVPRSPVIWRYLGFICLKNNEFLQAVNYFQTSLRLDTKSVASWEGLGEAYSEEGKYMAALKAFARAHELAPESYFSVYQSAHIRMKLGSFKEAIRDLVVVQDALADASEPSLVPCLKSLAECYLYASRESWNLGAYGVCVDQLNAGLEACLAVLDIGKGYQSVFKILGDICASMYGFRSGRFGLIRGDLIRRGLQALHIEVMDVGLTEETSAGTYHEALQLAVAAFKAALQICNTQSGPDSVEASIVPSYLHDLALAYYYSYELLHDAETFSVAEEVLMRCMQCMWKALQADPTNEKLWNSLGVLSVTTNSKIAQHSFIKAAEFNEKAVEPWTNLGYFYYFNQEYDLAKHAFSRAQLLDPENCLSWYGQALINAQSTSADVVDLLDHANDLAQGQNIEVGFSYALSEYKRYTAALEQDPSTLATPIFSMLKFCEIRPQDVAGFNLLGLLREKQGMHEEAARILKLALDACDTGIGAAILENVLINYARSCCSAGLYADAIETYTRLFAQFEGDVLARVGFGMALFFEQRLEESLRSFQTALDMLGRMETSDVGLQNRVGLLLSQVLYALGTDVHLQFAQSQLMECIQRPGSFPQAVISLLALGIVCQNNELAQSAAAELLKEKPEALTGLEAERNQILSKFFLLQGGVKLSRGFLEKDIHQAPWKASPWLMLSDNISRYAAEIGTPLVTVAKSAVLLQYSHNRVPPIPGSLRASLHQSLGHALLTRHQAPATGPVSSEGRGNSMLQLTTSRSCFNSAVHANPSNARMWNSLAIETRKQLTKEAAKLGDATQTNAAIESTESVCKSALVLADPASLDAQWSNLVLADTQVLRASLLLTTQDDGQEAGRSILQRVLEATEVYRSNMECVDRRVMSMGYAIGARALFVLGDHVTAYSAYRNALTVTPDAFQILEELADAYINTSKFTQGVHCLMQALRMCSYSSARAMILSRLARVHFMTGNMNESSEAMNQLRAMALEGESTGEGSRDNQLLLCISLLSVGSSGALAKLKKMVAALQEEGGCEWLPWVLSQM
ncbi:hypothetical protein BC830DRAFT_1169243 [Chytriomyces sp. MP71]|nr:hypothetical protein BC830DRAFT_1169243 [Chytriomyces sp. MP71]